MTSRKTAVLKFIPSLSISCRAGSCRTGRRRVRAGFFLWAALTGLGLLFLVHPNPAMTGSSDIGIKDPAVVHGVLPNGFQYVLMKNTTPEDRVSIHLNIRAGSVHETDDEKGIAHFLEHMLFNGTEHFPPGELVRYFQSIGMDFGADVNARTSFFHTVYDLNLPKGDQPHLEDALRVIQDYVGGALLLEEEIDRERGIILAEKQERDSVSYRTFKKSFAFELPGSILPERMPIGEIPVIEAADRELLKQFYDRWYRPDNMVLVMVGDMDLPVARQMIQERFHAVEPRSMTPAPPPEGIKWHPHTGVKPFYHHEPEAGNTRVTIERIEYSDSVYQTRARLKKEVTQQLGDAILQNRLSHLIRQGTTDFSSASAYTGLFLQHLSVAAVTAECNPDKWEQSLGQLEKILRQALESGFTQMELDRVKANAISGLDAGLRQAETRQTEELAGEILNAIQNKQLFLSPKQKKDLLAPHLENLTLTEVNQTFKDAWKMDHRLVLVTGNADIAADATGSAEETIKTVFKQSADLQADLFSPMVSKPFPYLPVPDTPTDILFRQHNVKDLGIDVVDLENQVRLNLKQTDFEQGAFLFKVVFGEGRACEPEGMPGIGHISQQTLRAGGLAALNPDQLEAALAGRDVQIEFSVEDAFFSLSGTADPGEIELVFQLIQAFLADPGFRPEALALAKVRYRQMYDALKQTPEGIMRIQGDRFLAGGNPWFGMPHPEQMDRITLADIQSWLSPYFNRGGFEVSVAGDFDPAQVVSHARVFLGGFVAPEKKVPCAADPALVVFPAGEDLNLVLDTKIEKGVVRIAFLTDDYWNISQTRALSILSRVISERLRKTIREKLGAAYSPYVFNKPSLIHDGYGVMQLVVPVTHENMDTVVQTAHEMVNDIFVNGLTGEETQLALNPVIEQLKVLRQTNAYWLNSVMADSRDHPERFDWANSIVSGYESITHEDLTTLAQTYLDPDKSAIVRILPAQSD
jgi:zinc protease